MKLPGHGCISIDGNRQCPAPAAKRERNMEHSSPKFPAGKRFFLSFVTPALLLLTAGATTSSAGCLDEAGEFV